MAKEKEIAAVLAVKVIPKSHKNELAGWENEELKVRLRAVPEKGEANEALIAFLAKTLNLSKSSLQLTHGETSRHKRVRFFGITLEELKIRIESRLKS
jgi:uncharacterized protein